ncbi:MAG: hypothetical protein D3919_07730 [Candidatus Electrothrix sp. AW5]|nr:hypothetical protein [Candidatus Electrothrix gigas]MCI5196107.1 hypothetical protein [Candidatus Electrothrix gigas]
MIMKDKVIEYYENTRQYYGTYHNHKEISAWAALALYIVFASLINGITLPIKLKIESASILTVFVLAVAILVYRYISTQIKMKDMAAAHAATAFLFLSEILSDDKNNNELIEYLKIEESDDTSVQSSHVLPRKFLKKSKVLNIRGRGFQDTTRSMIYSILFLVTLLVIFVKWYHVLG